jgi:hypothetical protein
VAAAGAYLPPANLAMEKDKQDCWVCSLPLCNAAYNDLSVGEQK